MHQCLRMMQSRSETAVEAIFYCVAVCSSEHRLSCRSDNLIDRRCLSRCLMEEFPILWISHMQALDKHVPCDTMQQYRVDQDCTCVDTVDLPQSMSVKASESLSNEFGAQQNKTK